MTSSHPVRFLGSDTACEFLGCTLSTLWASQAKSHLVPSHDMRLTSRQAATVLKTWVTRQLSPTVRMIKKFCQTDEKYIYWSHRDLLAAGGQRQESFSTRRWQAEVLREHFANSCRVIPAACLVEIAQFLCVCERRHRDGEQMLVISMRATRCPVLKVTPGKNSIKAPDWSHDRNTDEAAAVR